MKKERIDIEKKKELVPALRFDGFDGEWENLKVGQIAIKVGSGSTPSGGGDSYIFKRKRNF